MDMDSQASPYYPPRARWYSSFWRLWYPVRRRLYLDRLPKRGQYDLSQPLLGLVLPGWALLWSRRPILGVILGTIYCLSAAVFLVWIGYPVSNFALMVMMSIHAGGILRIEQSVGLWKRILSSLLVFFALFGLVYMPLEWHWFMPLQVNGRVIVTRANRARLVKRGDWIAYRLPEFHADGLRVNRQNCTLGVVMAVAGDQVVFGSSNVLVNGELHPLLPYMPTNRTVHMESRHWLIWPRMNISPGDGQGSIGDAMMRLAMVPEANYEGVPYQRWFWRKQTLP